MNEPTYKTISNAFDRTAGALTGLPDVTKTAPSTIVDHSPIVGDVTTVVVQTFRQREADGDGDRTRSRDFIFVQFLDASGGYRFVLPPAAADAIARQRDALTTRNRRTAAKTVANARKARGELPAVLKKKGGKK